MEIIRDPIWNNIRVDPLALDLVDTAAFQRLRYIRQLGLAYLVYPGATHTRFEHALGAYHLCKIAIALLRSGGSLTAAISDEECTITTLAALLHDVGHYPFSHALEELGATHHEEVAEHLICHGEVADILRARVASDAPERVLALIRGRSTSPLQGLISGSLDLDKIEYLKRDAHMCGVAYGEIDADRLINSMVLLEDDHGVTVGVAEKGLSALESLLFAKYQMYRNVYWHHAVRSATAMYKRIVEDARNSGALADTQLFEFTDEGLVYYLADHSPTPTLDALRTRRLYKRVAEWPASELEDGFGDWICTDRARVRAAEAAIAAELGIATHEVLIDYPEKTQMLGLDIPVLRRDGSTERLTSRGIAGAINLPKLSDQLYRSARWLRVFTCERKNTEAERVMSIIAGS